MVFFRSDSGRIVLARAEEVREKGVLFCQNYYGLGMVTLLVVGTVLEQARCGVLANA